MPLKKREKPEEVIEQEEVLQEETEVLEEQEAGEVSIEIMEKAIAVVQQEFNLKGRGFVVKSFTDKGSKCSVSLASEDFEIAICIKDSQRYGIID